MKNNAAKQDDFFDPASLALDEDDEEQAPEADAVPLELVQADASVETPPPPSFGDITPGAAFENFEAPHRLQSEFQDPLGELNLQGTTETPPAPLESGFAAAPEVAFELAPASNFPVENTPAPWMHTNGHSDYGRRAKMGEALFQLVLCERSFDQIAKDAMDAIVAALDAETGSLLEVDHQSNELFFRAISGVDDSKLKSVRLPLHTGFAGEIIRSGAAEIVHDTSGDPRFQRAIGMMAGGILHNAAAAPVLIAGRNFGVIEIFNKNGGTPFSDFDLATLRIGAAMLAKILEVRFFTALVNKG